jgi:phage gp46-like protein
MNDKFTDIKMRLTGNGYYDISFADGDIEKIGGFDTAIQISLLCEKRAIRTEILTAKRRRGTYINELMTLTNFEIGSKLWLLSQARTTNVNLNLGIDYARTSLQWFVDYGYADKISVTGEIKNDRMILNIVMFKNHDKIFSKGFDVWAKTFIDGEI